MATQTGSYDFKASKEASKTATSYITDLSNGIWVTPENRKPDKNGNPISSGNNATSGWHIADALEMFHKGVRRFKVWVENNVTKVRIGKDDLAHVDIDDDSIGLKIGDDRIFEVAYDGNRTQLWFSDSTLSDKLPAAGTKYTNAEAESIFDFISSSCHLNTTSLKILLNMDDSETGYTATDTGGSYYVHDAEGDAISCGNFSDICYSSSYGWYPNYYLEPLEEIPNRVVMNACEGEGDFSFRGGMYVDCKVNSGLHSSIKNIKWLNLLEPPDIGAVSKEYAVNIKGVLSKIMDSLNGTHTLHTTINSNASTQSADTWRYFRAVDKNDVVYGQIGIAARANGSNTTGIYAYKTVNGSLKTNALYVGVDKNGNLIYTISSPSAFRTALQLPDLIQRGTTASQSVATKAYKDVSVTFSPAFSSTPTVTCSLVSSSTSSDIGAMSVAVESVSTTGATFRIFNYSANTRAPAVSWIATNL